jgi:Bacterial Ig-like domain
MPGKYKQNRSIFDFKQNLLNTKNSILQFLNAKGIHFLFIALILSTVTVGLSAIRYIEPNDKKANADSTSQTTSESSSSISSVSITSSNESSSFSSVHSSSNLSSENSTDTTQISTPSNSANVVSPKINESQTQNVSNPNQSIDTSITKTIKTKKVKQTTTLESGKTLEIKKSTLNNEINNTNNTQTSFGDIKIELSSGTEVSTPTKDVEYEETLEQDQNFTNQLGNGINSVARTLGSLVGLENIVTEPLDQNLIITGSKSLLPVSVQNTNTTSISGFGSENKTIPNTIPTDSDKLTFDFGKADEHLMFSKAAKVSVATNLADGSTVDVKVKHLGDTEYNYSGLISQPTFDSGAECGVDGLVSTNSLSQINNFNSSSLISRFNNNPQLNSSSQSTSSSQSNPNPNLGFKALGGFVTFYTCGASTFTITPASGTVTITSPAPLPAPITNYTTRRPTFSGTGTVENATLTITLNGSSNSIGTTTVVGGAWSLVPSSDLPNGNNTLCIGNSIANGGTLGQVGSSCVNFTVGIVLTVDPLPLQTLTSKPTISGNCTPGNNITIDVINEIANSIIYYNNSLVCGSSGTYSNIISTNIPNNTQFRVNVTNSVSTATTTSTTDYISNVTIDTLPIQITTRTPTITGTCTPNSVLNIRMFDEVTPTNVFYERIYNCTTSGVYSFTPTGNFTHNKTLRIIAEATLSGNTSFATATTTTFLFNTYHSSYSTTVNCPDKLVSGYYNSYYTAYQTVANCSSKILTFSGTCEVGANVQFNIHLAGGYRYSTDYNNGYYGYAQPGATYNPANNIFSTNLVCPSNGQYTVTTPSLPVIGNGGPSITSVDPYRFYTNENYSATVIQSNPLLPTQTYTSYNGYSNSVYDLVSSVGPLCPGGTCPLNLPLAPIVGTCKVGTNLEFKLAKNPSFFDDIISTQNLACPANGQYSFDLGYTILPTNDRIDLKITALEPDGTSLSLYKGAYIPTNTITPYVTFDGVCTTGNVCNTHTPTITGGCGGDLSLPGGVTLNILDPLNNTTLSSYPIICQPNGSFSVLVTTPLDSNTFDYSNVPTSNYQITISYPVAINTQKGFNVDKRPLITINDVNTTCTENYYAFFGEGGYDYSTILVRNVPNCYLTDAPIITGTCTEGSNLELKIQIYSSGYTQTENSVCSAAGVYSIELDPIFDTLATQTKPSFFDAEVKAVEQGYTNSFSIISKGFAVIASPPFVTIDNVCGLQPDVTEYANYYPSICNTSSVFTESGTCTPNANINIKTETLTNPVATVFTSNLVCPTNGQYSVTSDSLQNANYTSTTTISDPINPIKTRNQKYYVEINFTPTFLATINSLDSVCPISLSGYDEYSTYVGYKNVCRSDNIPVSGTCTPGGSLKIEPYTTTGLYPLYIDIYGSSTNITCPANGEYSGSVNSNFGITTNNVSYSDFKVKVTNTNPNNIFDNTKAIKEFVRNFETQVKINDTNINCLVEGLCTSNTPTFTGICTINSLLDFEIRSDKANAYSTVNFTNSSVCPATGIFSIPVTTSLPSAGNNKDFYQAKAKVTNPDHTTFFASVQKTFDVSLQSLSNIAVDCPKKPNGTNPPFICSTQRPNITGSCTSGSNISLKLYQTDYNNVTINGYAQVEAFVSPSITCNTLGQFSVPITIDLNNGIQGFMVKVLSAESSNSNAVILDESLKIYFDTAPNATLNNTCPETYANSGSFVCKTHFPNLAGTCDLGTKIKITLTYAADFAQYYNPKLTAFDSLEVSCSTSGTFSIPVTTRLDNAMRYPNGNDPNSGPAFRIGRVHYINAKVYNPLTPGNYRSFATSGYSDFNKSLEINTIPEFTVVGSAPCTGITNGGISCPTNYPVTTGNCTAGTYLRQSMWYYASYFDQYYNNRTYTETISTICKPNGTYIITHPFVSSRAFTLETTGIDPFDSNVTATKTAPLNVTLTLSAILDDFCQVVGSELSCPNQYPNITGTCNAGGSYRLVVSKNDNSNTKYLDTTGTCLGSNTFSYQMTTPLPSASNTTYKAETFVSTYNSAYSRKVFGVNPVSFATLNDFCPVTGAGMLCATKLPVITGTCHPGDNLKLEVKGDKSNGYTNSISDYTNASICPTNGMFSITPDVAILTGVASGDYYKITATSTDLLNPYSTATASKLFDVSSSVNLTLITPRITSDQTPTLSGGCTPANGDIKLTITPGNEILNTTCSATNTYSATPNSNIPFGNYVVKAQLSISGVLGDQVINNGVISNSFATISVPEVSRLNKPVITGDCEPGTALVFTFTPGNEIVNQTCSTNGTYSVNPVNPIVEGTYNVSLSATSPAGSNITINGQGTINTLTFVSIVVPNPSLIKKPTITGTCITGIAIVFTVVPTNEIVNQTCPASETFSFPLTQNIPDGNYGVKATVASIDITTSFGTMDASTFLSIATPPLTSSHFPNISGLCEAGSALTFNIIPTNEIKNMTCANDGTFSFAVTYYVSDGTYTISGGAIDNKGNVANASANSEITSRTFVTTKFDNLEVNYPTYSGTCHKGDNVLTKVISNVNPTVETVYETHTFVCDINTGTYSFTVATFIPHSTALTILASATDSAGNTAADIKFGTLTIPGRVSVACDDCASVHKPTFTGTCIAGDNIKLNIYKQYKYVYLNRDPILDVNADGTYNNYYGGYFIQRLFLLTNVNQIYNDPTPITFEISCGNTGTYSIPVTQNFFAANRGCAYNDPDTPTTIASRGCVNPNCVIPNIQNLILFYSNNTTYNPFSTGRSEYYLGCSDLSYSAIATSSDPTNSHANANAYKPPFNSRVPNPVSISNTSDCDGATCSTRFPTFNVTCKPGYLLNVKIDSNFVTRNFANYDTVCPAGGLHVTQQPLRVPYDMHVSCYYDYNSVQHCGPPDAYKISVVSSDPIEPTVKTPTSFNFGQNVPNLLTIVNPCTNVYDHSPAFVNSFFYCTTHHPVVTGECIPGHTLKIKATGIGNDGLTTVSHAGNIYEDFTGVCPASGQYSQRISKPIPNKVIVEGSDSNSNFRSFKSGVSVKVDTVNPDEPTEIATRSTTLDTKDAPIAISLTTPLSYNQFIPNAFAPVNITSDSTPTISGTCTPAGTILKFTIIPTNEVVDSVCSGTFSFVPATPIPNGNFSITADALVAGIEEGQSIAIGSVNPNFVTIATPARNIVNKPPVTGICEAGAALTFTFTPTNEVKSFVCPANGHYTINKPTGGIFNIGIDTIIPDGAYTVTINAVSANTGAINNVTVNGLVDTTYSVTIIPDTAIFYGNTLSFHGDCEPGSTLTFNYIPTVVTCPASGLYTATGAHTLPTEMYDDLGFYRTEYSGLGYGNAKAQVTSVDTFGNNATAKASIEVNIDTYTDSSTQAINALKNPTIKGYCESGSTVGIQVFSYITDKQAFIPYPNSNTGYFGEAIILEEANPVYQTTVNCPTQGDYTFSQYNYSVTIPGPLKYYYEDNTSRYTNRFYKFKTVATDPQGNIATKDQDFKLDGTNNLKDNYSYFFNGSYNNFYNSIPLLTNNNRLPITIPCYSGDLIEAKILPTNEVISGICSGASNFIITPTVVIPDGQYSATYKSTKPTGATGYDYYRLFLNGSPITGTCYPGDTIKVILQEQNQPVRETLDASCSTAGLFSVTPIIPIPNGIASGRYTAKITSTRNSAQAGFTNTINSYNTGKVDTINTVTLVGPNPGIEEFGDINGNVTFSGTCEPGAILNLQRAEPDGTFGSTLTFESSNYNTYPLNHFVAGTCPITGNYSVAIGLNNRVYKIRAWSKDLANNTVQSSNFSEGSSLILTVVPGGFTTDTTPEISGRCYPGANLAFTVSTTSESFSTVCPTNGSYAISPTIPIPDGRYNDQYYNYGSQFQNITIVSTLTNTPTTTVRVGYTIDSTTFATVTTVDPATSATPVITGTCEIGGSVILVINSIITPLTETSPSLPCTTNGTFTYNTIDPMLNGAYSVKVNANDQYNNAIEITKNGIINSSVVSTINIPATGNNHFPIITGNCEPNSQVKVTIVETNEVFNFVCSSINGPNSTSGRYSVTPTISIPDGSYKVKIFAIGLLSRTGLAFGTGVIDASTVVSINVPITSVNSRPQFSGTCEAGATLSVIITLLPSNTLSQTIPNFVCGATGSYSVNPITNIAVGDYKADITAVDLYGNIGTATDTGKILPGGSFVTISVPLLTDDNTPTITGTCDTGATLIIKTYSDANTTPVETLPSFVCDGTGNYSISPTTALIDGAYSARVDSSNINLVLTNAIASGVIDTSTFVTISVPELTNSHFPVITGTCEVGASLEIKTSSGTNTTPIQIINQICPSNAAPATPTVGTYTATPTVSIPNGNYSATVVALDAAGNTATATDTGVIDDAITITISVPPLTNNPKPPITGNCKAGASVTVKITNGTPSTNPLQSLTPFVCPTSGTYSTITTANIPDGPYCANATTVDGIGNTAGPVQSCGIIDTSTFITVTPPPTTPTKDPKPPVLGTCEKGGIVTIKITNGTVSATNPNPTVIQTLPNFTCDNTGTYSVVPTNPIPDGPYCAIGHIVDAAGNTADSSAGCGVIDTSTFVTISVPELTNSHFPVITGTCEVGASLEIKTSSGTNTTPIQIINQICPSNAAPATPTVGTYTATPTVSIPNGNYSATVVALDAAGNTATATDTGVIDDAITITISVPPLTNNPKPPITGNCKAGASVTVKITNGTPSTNPLQSLTPFVCPTSGTYSTITTANIPDGPYCANATTVDGIGNTAGPVQSCGIIDTSTFITVTPPPTTPTKDPKPPVLGTCEKGGIVTIKITNGTVSATNPNPTVIQTLPNFTCDNTGTYSVVPTNPIPDGPYCAIGHIVDAAGNTADSSAGCGVIDTSTFVTIVVPPITSNPRPAITGTCETGATVVVKVTVGAANTLNQTLPSFVCVGGIYSVIPISDIPQGPYCARADARDDAGNTATAQGCGDVFVTVDVPTTTTNHKPEIAGTCTPSTAGGYQVPVKVVIKVGAGNIFNEELNTFCSITGTYRVTPQVIIPSGPFSATATATDAIGNQAIATDSGIVTDDAPPGGPTIRITPEEPKADPEIFDNISDPYVCGKAITGKVTDNYGVKTIVVKLFASQKDQNGNTAYDTTPKYIFRPSLTSQGQYTIDLNYIDTAVFVKGDYRVEYSAQSNTNAVRTGSYLARITDQCSDPIPTILQETVEITPEGKVTIRTGGNNELYFIALTLTLALSGYGWYRLKRKDVVAGDVFGG